METLKVKINKVIQPEVVEQQEKEIALPFFSKIGLGVRMIREDKSVIAVIRFASWEEWNIYWSKGSAAEMQKAVDGEIISREEFYEQYNKAMDFIQGHPIPTREEVEQTETSNI